MAKAEAAGKKLYTLTEVARKTNISMPTLQRYKKLYQDRIPSQGQGRLQRYPEEALAVFQQLKTENLGRRGRPRKNAAATTKPKRAAKKGRKRVPKKPTAKPAEGLLTLTQIGQMTAISYPTLLRYVKTNLKNIPHKGSGRARRYLPEAVAVFKEMRSQSKRGRKPKKAMAGSARRAGAAPAKKAAKTSRRRGRPRKTVDPGDIVARLKDLEKVNKSLVREIERMKKKLAKPIRVVWR